ncbi:NUDIX hydrolase [Spirosoma aerophilum]
MTDIEAAIDYILNGHQQYMAHLSLDCAILGYHEQQVKILLIRYKGHEKWGLPGGPIRHEEPIAEAANRIAEETTGIENLFLQQFYTFGDSPYRVRNRTIQDLQRTIPFDELGISIKKDNWLLGRQMSIGYYALVDYQQVSVRTNLFFEEYRWWDIDQVPELLFDHNDVVTKALETVRLHLYHQPIGANLLPPKFTLPEIHFLYESLLGQTLDRRNFPKKLFALGLLNKLDEQRYIGPHRSPNLYEFNKANYERALEEGIVLVI